MIIRSFLLVGALATGFTPSLVHANTHRAAEPVAAAPVTPLAAMTANAAMRGVMSAFGELGELAMRDLASRDLQDFRGGRDTVVISTSTLIIILLVILILVIVL